VLYIPHVTLHRGTAVQMTPPQHFPSWTSLLGSSLHTP